MGMEINAKSSHNLFSVVSILVIFMGCFLVSTYARAADPVTTAPAIFGGKTGEQLAAESKDKKDAICASAVDAAVKARNEAHAACKGAGADDQKTCEEKAKTCSDMDEEEREASKDNNILGSSISTIAQSMGINYNPTQNEDFDGNYRGLCMNHKDFKSEKDDLKRDLEKAEDKVSKLQKDIAREQEDNTKETKKAQDDVREILKKGREDDTEQAKNSRKRQEEQQANTVQTQESLQELRGNVIKRQGELAKSISERTRLLIQLTDSMIGSNCLEKIEKIRETQKNLLSASYNYVAKQRTIINNRQKLMYRNCIQESVALREATRQQADAQIKAVENDIERDTKKIQGLEQALSLRNQNLATEAQEAEKNKNQAQQERLQAIQSANQQLTTNNQTYSTKLQQMNDELNRAKKKMNEHSNRLASLGSKSAGESAPSDALTKYRTAAELLKICKSRCSNTCPGIDPDAPGSAPATPSPAAPTTGTDGAAAQKK